MVEEVPITIVGGGVIGCAIAYELSKSLESEIFLIEKNSNIRGENQSSRNSGVIHAGIYYQKKKGPLKARFCVNGNKMLYEFCEKYDVPYNKTGKLVVATNQTEEEYLDDVLETALDNEVPNVKRITGKEAREFEPNINASSAIYVPTSGIVEPTELVNKLHKLAENDGAYFITGNKVIDVNPKKDLFQITTKSGDNLETFETRILINSAGLYSDEIAKMVNPNSSYEIEPVKGEAAKFYKTGKNGVFMNGMNIYPAPYGFYNENGEKAEVSFKEFLELLKDGKVTKTVGVHLTPTFDIKNGKYVVGETVTIGPSSTFGVGKEDYSHSHPEEYYLQKVKDFFPNLKLEDIALHQTGIRAKLKDHYDFIIEKDSQYPNCINLIGIDSPGLTSSLAIAKYVKELVKERLEERMKKFEREFRKLKPHIKEHPYFEKFNREIGNKIKSIYDEPLSN